ncbi:DNA (cytosine-5)-methyltransferase 3A-like [Argiope bruennichi]|uniref:DNA (Cytosine-5)-methyltransferase 3A like protein n=1 Tax=Argiope bruennichi TaxID=94029 RepID=A0A8T0FI64_ARGBR|nr:DNA (cytosine-5)-methyltransferase 3A-like [Argiope bruennichi]KAF8790947.1 DNA (cytosine-5)-methyltransferase 3A like protein [Argiope bruennichi]
MLKRSSIVWGKLKGLPWWPGIVVDADDCGQSNVRNDHQTKLWIFWFGDHKVSQVESKNLKEFEENFCEKSVSKNKLLKCAVEEVLIILADRYNIEYSDPSSLFEWAKEGFKKKMPLPSGESISLYLPDIVKTALQKHYPKRKSESSSEDDSENEIVNVLNEVSKGRKSLEDICVMCCKSKNSVIMKHPLFVGGVCQKCKKDMDKIIEADKGKANDICVLCGQGGNLIYCGNSMCLCAYCKTCIDYMAPKGSFSKILKDNDWKCYLCEPKRQAGCLIKRREIYLSMSAATPIIPPEKVPIRVIGDTNAALSVLKKKKIAVDLYCTESSQLQEPSTSKRHDLYTDFSDEEFHEISADFVFGSFFVPSSVVDDREKVLESFSTSFYRFLYRLNGARVVMPSLFFFYMSDGEFMDDEIKSRVMQFLRVDPIIVMFPLKNIYLWTNVPPIKGIKNRKYSMKRNLHLEIEEDILDKFLEPLKNFYKKE